MAKSEHKDESEDKEKPAEHKLKPNFLNRHLKLVITTVLIVALLIWGPTIYAKLSTRHERYDLNKTSINDVPQRQVALVLGAGVLPDGTPSPYLQWRVDTAVKLYKAHRVHVLLMSADNSSKHYNEPVAMQKLAHSEGVPQKAIVLDYAGFSTYDSCYRAGAIFKVKSAIIVSQGYHLPRAVMTCNDLGVSSIGVRALHNERDFALTYILREWLSTDKAVIQLITKPHPTFLGPTLPIH